ncbi:hypothetical protein [Plantactinospora sp. GCM10030261]|uniref:hypothetical protein n=1 Tax=Plantactinospora sp. GCM10030261 TaxID=3273420 RepID=UPI0036149760
MTTREQPGSAPDSAPSFAEGHFPVRRLAASAFAVGYGLVRWYWAAGGRWGYTACDRTDPPDAPDAATGCGADAVRSLSFWAGWGAVGLCVALVLLAVVLRRLPALVATAGAWTAALTLLVLAFPMHLVFEIPAGLTGHPTDWRDIAHRLGLTGGGLLWAAIAVALRSRCPHRRSPAGPRPVPRELRRRAYAGFLLPVLGFTVPHAIWLLGVPMGIPADVHREVLTDMDGTTGWTLTLVPTVGGLLTLGLAARWGQVFPRWVPRLAGCPVPPPLALVPAALVALALTAYGLIGLGLIGGALADGTTTWAGLADSWAVVGTEVVFLAWGVALGQAAHGYHRLTRPPCAACGVPAPFG